SMESDILWLGARSHNADERLDVRTGETVGVPRDAYPNIRHGFDAMLHNSNRCGATGATLSTSDAGMELKIDDREQPLAQIEGYRHFRFPAIDRAAFIADCQYVICYCTMA